MDLGDRVGGCVLAFFSIKYGGTQHALNLTSQQSYRPRRRALLVNRHLVHPSLMQQRAVRHLAFGIAACYHGKYHGIL